ncbi:MAG: SDR family NAD(P)-dependent oxidoreductase, partial [Promethearchaeota archaeon]
GIKSIETSIQKIISEITGYNVEDLELGFDLEEDLGIDTIKQAEIFGQIREKWQIPENVEVNLADFRTIEDIVRIIRSLEKPSKNAFSSNSEDISHDFQYLENIEEDSENNISIFSLKSILLEKPSEREENEEIYKRPLVLIEFNDHSHLNDKVQEVLQSRQIKIIPVILNTEYNSDEIKRFTENIKEKHHVDAITLGIITPALEQEDYFQSSESILMVLFHFLKALNPAIIQSCFILSNETILSSTDISNPVSSGISGFLKSLGKEFKFEFRHIYFYDVKDAISELLYQETLSEIIYNKEGLRHTIDRVKILPTDNAKSINIEENDLVLVTGGARGITFECIDKWTNSVHPSLILIGRTPYDSSLESYLHYTEEQLTNLKKQKIRYLKKHNPSITPVQVQKEWKKFLNQLELIKNLRKLRNKGIQVEYYDCDVTDYDKMAEIYEKIKNQFKTPVSVIIHGAGMEESKNFEKKSASMVKLIHDIKVKGFSNLLKIFSKDFLKYCVVFSSIAGRYGNTGQVDYAYANAFLSRMAWNSHNSIPMLVIDWSAWTGVGMATQGSTLKILEMAGVTPIPVRTGTEIFSFLLRNGYTGEYIVAGNMGIFEPNLTITTNLEPEKFPMISSVQYHKGDTFGIHKLSTKRDFYLIDHQIGSKPVFPGVMVLESFAEFYNSISQEDQFDIIDVEYKVPLKMLEGKETEIKMLYNSEFVKEQEDNYGKVIPYLIFQSISYPKVMKGKPLVKNHFTGKILSLSGNSMSSSLSIKIPKHIPFISLFSQEEIYSIFFHGPRFKVIEKLLIWEQDSLLTKISCKNELLFSSNLQKPSKERFLFNPLGIESLFQTAALYDLVRYSQLSLPSKIGKIHKISNEIPQYAYVIYRGRDGTHSYFDAVLLNSDKSPILELYSLGLIHTDLQIPIKPYIKEKLEILAEIGGIFPSDYNSQYHILPLLQLRQKFEENPSLLGQYLTDNEIQQIQEIKNEKRRYERIAGIICAKNAYFKFLNKSEQYLAIEVIKKKTGQPFMKSSKSLEILPVYLSITHSNSFACAVVSNHPIGIDLEKIKDRNTSFYKEVFTPLEQRFIQENSLLGTKFWTIKEAFSKAIGTGLCINLKQLEISHSSENNHFDLTYLGEEKRLRELVENVKWISNQNKNYILSLCEIPKEIFKNLEEF